MNSTEKLTVLCALFAALVLAAGSSKAEPAKVAASEKTNTRAIPFVNYWDAKAWDRSGGGIFFWQKQTEDRTSPKKVKQNMRAAKNNRSSAPLSGR